MKFKKGKLYRVVKYVHSKCKGCVLKYSHTENYMYNNIWDYFLAIHELSHCREKDSYCGFVRELATLVKYPNMIEFCKKLKKERSNVR